jgi:ABC-type phosphate transport system substrate-binding protein
MITLAPHQLRVTQTAGPATPSAPSGPLIDIPAVLASFLAGLATYGVISGVTWLTHGPLRHIYIDVPALLVSLLAGLLTFLVIAVVPRLRRVWAAAAVALVMVITAGFVSIVVIPSQVPHPVCARGSVSFKGSTAVAPIVTQVAFLYEQSCPGARIAVRAVGSGQGIKDLANSTSQAPVIAMYDGQPPPGSPGASDAHRPVGVVIFAVVGNKMHLPPLWFATGPGGGLTGQQIRRAHADPQGFTFQTPDGLHSVVPVGRTSLYGPAASGTRTAFVEHVIGRPDTTAEQKAPPCPAATSNSVCLEGSTMELFSYVNQKWYSIGYAEPDALTYFSNLGVIPININDYGYGPTRANALNRHYTFIATENLYWKGKQTRLARDFISFLTSKPVTALLRRTLFIGCSDLTGTKLNGACA